MGRISRSKSTGLTAGLVAAPSTRVAAANDRTGLSIRLDSRVCTYCIVVDLSLRFPESGRGSEGLGHGLAVDFTGEAQLRIVTWIVRFGAMASGFPQRRADRAKFEPGRK